MTLTSACIHGQGVLNEEGLKGWVSLSACPLIAFSKPPGGSLRCLSEYVRPGQRDGKDCGDSSRTRKEKVGYGSVQARWQESVQGRGITRWFHPGLRSSQGSGL